MPSLKCQSKVRATGNSHNSSWTFKKEFRESRTTKTQTISNAITIKLPKEQNIEKAYKLES